MTGNDKQTQFILDSNVCPTLVSLIDNPKETISKGAVWTLSNITAGTSSQIQSVIDAGAFPKLIQLTSEVNIQKEAAWAVANATSGVLRTR